MDKSRAAAQPTGQGTLPRAREAGLDCVCNEAPCRRPTRPGIIDSPKRASLIAPMDM